MPDTDEPQDHLSPGPEGSPEDSPPLLPWAETIRQNPGRVALAGGALVLVLILGLVFVWGGSSTPRDSKALHTSLFSPLREITVPTTVPRTKSSTGTTQPPAKSTGSVAGTTTPAKTTTPFSPQPCSAIDLTFVTTTDSTSYSPGSVVTITTKITDNFPCVFTPVASGEYGCATTVVVTDATSGAQVYPMPGQVEQCAPVTGGLLSPGATRSATLEWNQQTIVSGNPGQTPNGNYRAYGIWTFGSGTNAPNGGLPASEIFTIG